MMKTNLSLLLGIFMLLTSVEMKAQKVVKLWDGNPPIDNEIKQPEKYDKTSGWITDVSVPELSIYLPDKSKNTRMAVIICPGGGYAGLAFEHEGTQFATWLNEQGIAAVILKYRMPNKHKEIPLDDAQQAMRYVRTNAGELGIDVNKIGIAGFSAGGHLASTVSTHYATSGISTRPDFSILFYPVVTMEVATHGGSKMNLLGDNPSSVDVYTFSNEKQVNVNTPPTILLLSDDDESVAPENSILYYNALKRNRVPATMYIFPEGGHGWGMRKNFKYHTQMQALLQMWVKDLQNKL
ncbi:alpha/beta hydrolase [Dysgonomonas sp. Marseille-P4677]|uniref:alpha/beta hydrolase n=1 Tax=Dysgonomonas sp. Marseille-P4677 TaxID=2364790 RepID=UPI001914CF2C|nr:alpha/beta hydrolase [Dysgonomonas sp. Marseille-P4677]MBK5719650.1 alpha/beta hydrolase [Dysgonomonas sp. Marseille-P4677]